jgi:hypothetical protein
MNAPSEKPSEQGPSAEAMKLAGRHRPSCPSLGGRFKCQCDVKARAFAIDLHVTSAAQAERAEIVTMLRKSADFYGASKAMGMADMARLWADRIERGVRLAEQSDAAAIRTAPSERQGGEPDGQ